ALAAVLSAAEAPAAATRAAGDFNALRFPVAHVASHSAGLGLGDRLGNPAGAGLRGLDPLVDRHGPRLGLRLSLADVVLFRPGFLGLLVHGERDGLRFLDFLALVPGDGALLGN